MFGRLSQTRETAEEENEALPELRRGARQEIAGEWRRCRLSFGAAAGIGRRRQGIHSADSATSP